MTQSDQAIRLPRFDPSRTRAAAETALLGLADEPNPFGGIVGPFAYQFEGEDDLLHLFVMRLDHRPLSVEEGQAVVEFVIPEVPASMIWLKPGRLSQHFYFGHDLLAGRSESSAAS